MYKTIQNNTFAIVQTDKAILIEFSTDKGKFKSWIPKTQLIINAKKHLLINRAFIVKLCEIAKKELNASNLIIFKP